METNEVDINTEYLTYAGINRSALILGMPMIAISFHIKMMRFCPNPTEP